VSSVSSYGVHLRLSYCYNNLILQQAHTTQNTCAKNGHQQKKTIFEHTHRWHKTSRFATVFAKTRNCMYKNSRNEHVITICRRAT